MVTCDGCDLRVCVYVGACASLAIERVAKVVAFGANCLDGRENWGNVCVNVDNGAIRH